MWSSILSCVQLVVGSNQTVSVDYTHGGRPAILVPSQLMTGTGLCGYNANNPTNAQSKSANNGGTSAIVPKYSFVFVAFFTLFFEFVNLSL